MRLAKASFAAVAGLAAIHAAIPLPAGAQSPGASPLESLLSAQIDAAAKYGQPIREAPASVSVITADDIRDHGFRTLGELLIHAREFYLADSGFETRVGIRGVSRLADLNNRMLVLLDDHVMNDSFYGAAPVGSDFGVPLDAVERVEVIRGPGSSLYGSNAMLAVVRVVTRTGRGVDGMVARAEVGVPQRSAASVVYGRELGDAAEVLVTASWSDSNADSWYLPGLDFRDLRFEPLVPGRRREQHRDAFVSAQYAGFYARAMVSRRDRDLTPQDPALARDAWERGRVQGFAEVGRRWRVGSALEFQLRGFYDRISNGEAVIGSGFLVDLETRGKWVGGEAQFGWDVGSWGRVTGGGEYRANLEALLVAPHLAEGGIEVAASDRQVSGYSQVEVQPLTTLSLVAGIRADHYEGQGRGITPRFAVVYYPTNATTLKLLRGKAYRAPHVFELNSDILAGMYPSRDGLRGEEITTTELILEQRLARGVFGSISGYQHRTGAIIDIAVDTATWHMALQNMPGIEGRGVALGLRAALPSGLRADASYVWQRTEDTETGARVTDGPSRMIRLGAAYPILPGTIAALDVVHDGPRTVLTTPAVDAQTLVGASINSERLWGPFGASLQVRNLFDSPIEIPSPLAAGGAAIPQAGRSVHLSLTARL